jgi:hypothetical protein
MHPEMSGPYAPSVRSGSPAPLKFLAPIWAAQRVRKAICNPGLLPLKPRHDRKPTHAHFRRQVIPAGPSRGRGGYSQIVRAYGLRDEVSLRILEEACASLQRARMARETIDREGMTFPDAKGNPKMHPACVVERDSRAAALAAFRQLNLELPRISTNKRQVW